MISEIMTRNIIFCHSNDSLKEVSNIMKENNIGFIPVKDNNKYIGVITDRDICLSIPTIKDINTKIKSYIKNNIIYIDVYCSIEDALKLMSKYKIKRLLVKEKDNTIGVLSLSDILNYTTNNKFVETCKSIFSIHNNTSEFNLEIDEFYL